MNEFKILNKKIGANHPTYIIAEISCNHEGNFEEAVKIIEAAAEAGADAVKLQTYKPETITRNFNTKPKGTIWENTDLFDIYNSAQTPWDWYSKLNDVAVKNGLALFSSPFDETAVDFLETQNTPIYKIPSFEIVDTKLLEKVAKTKKPVIMSNGMTNFLEMREAYDQLKKFGCNDIAILQCNSGYPANFHEANLKTIPVIEKIFNTVVGLSDHTLFADTTNYETPLPHITPLESVKFGARIIEIHLMLDRKKARTLMENKMGGYDWPFSREPKELKLMIDCIRSFEKYNSFEYQTELEKKMALITHGKVSFKPTEKELASRKVRPSLWIVNNIKANEPFVFAAENKENGNFDSIRPSGGLHIRYTDLISKSVASRDISAGQQVDWSMIKFND